MQAQKVTVRIKKRNFGKLRRFVNRDDRSIARMWRRTKNAILEMHAKTMAYRAVLADYDRWTKTSEYQEEVKRMDELMIIVNTYLAREENAAAKDISSYHP